jgi:hypothetical protein
VERTIRTLMATKLQRAKVELEAFGKSAEPDVNRMLGSLALYGHRQPISRESRPTMRRKIKSPTIRCGIPAVWFTLNPNDVTNPINLEIAALQPRDGRG